MWNNEDKKDALDIIIRFNRIKSKEEQDIETVVTAVC